MKITRSKHVIIIIAIISVIASIGSISLAGAVVNQCNKLNLPQPKSVWVVVCDLQSQINGLSAALTSETSQRQSADSNLQTQIDELNARVTSLENPQQPPPITDITIPVGGSTSGCEETNSCYVPFSTIVPVKTEITWTNSDSAAHTVTSGNPTNGPDGVFDSSLFGPGKTFSHKFDQEGTFHYFCMVHPWMRGQVIIS